MLANFFKYARTLEFSQGLYVEIAGILIEIALLVITIPLVLHVYNRFRTRRLRHLATFYLFQIFHEVADIFLDMASVEDIHKILGEELSRNPHFLIYGGGLYGNLENKLFVFKKVVDEGRLATEYDKKSIEDFRRYRGIAQGCLDEIDRITSMISSIPSTQERLFRLRMLVYPLRDKMAWIEEAFDAGQVPFRSDGYEMAKIAGVMADSMEGIFRKDRKLVDSVQSMDNLFRFVLWAGASIWEQRRRLAHDSVAFLRTVFIERPRSSASGQPRASSQRPPKGERAGPEDGAGAE